MKSAACLLALVVAWALAAEALEQPDRDEQYQAQERKRIQKSVNFSHPGAPKELVIDNIEGSIRVAGYEGSTVQVEIEQLVRGRSQSNLELAKKEVELKISEQNNRIELYVDGPFRCQCSEGSMGTRRRDYRVRFDFLVKVPRECSIRLRTVNDGDIRVENVAGKYDVEHVNGRIEMSSVGGSGRVHTVNGAVRVTLSRNPEEDSSFGAVNGNIDVAFRPGLSADLWFKTFNGNAYTDIELTPLPQPAATQERKNGKFVYKSNRFYGARAGRGGPQIKFDAFNGNIHITAR